MTQMNPNMPATAGVPTHGPIPGAGYEKRGDEVTDGDSRPDTTGGAYDDAVNDLVPEEVANNNIDSPGTEDTAGEAAQTEEGGGGSFLDKELGDRDPFSTDGVQTEDDGRDERVATGVDSKEDGAYDSSPLPGVKAGDGEDPNEPQVQRAPGS